MKHIEINTAKYPRDVERIQKALLNAGYESTLGECESLWDKYSDSMCAGWMNLPETDDDIFRCISPYINNQPLPLVVDLGKLLIKRKEYENR